MTPASDYSLGIESAINGGSLSLFHDGTEIACSSGNGAVARAEELLPSIDQLVRDNDLTLRDLDTIAVSTGPGSYTGIRVGIATVLGLRASLKMRCVGLSSLQAMALSIENQPNVMAAVPMGRNMVCSQLFERGRALTEPQLSTVYELIDSFEEFDGVAVLYKSIYDEAANTGRPKIVDGGSNIASYLVAAANSEFASQELTPLFVDRS